MNLERLFKELEEWTTSKGFLSTVPPGCRTETVLLPLETSIPTAFNIVSDLSTT
jgi:hypothetical protein